MQFLIPSLCPDCGGRVFVVTDPEDLSALESYYTELSRASAAFFSWVFVEGNVLVQINGDLPEETAQRYQVVLKDF